MSTLTFTMHRVGPPCFDVSEDDALKQPARYPARKAVIIVRNQMDCDFMEGLALVSGKPVEVIVDENPIAYHYYPPYSWVFIADE